MLTVQFGGFINGFTDSDWNILHENCNVNPSPGWYRKLPSVLESDGSEPSEKDECRRFGKIRNGCYKDMSTLSISMEKRCFWRTTATLITQEEAVVAAVNHDRNFISSQPIPFAIRNWVFGTALGALLILIQVSYQGNKGALILFDMVHRVNMELMISAFILFLWATVVERTIICLGGCGNCLTVIFWKNLFGHIADVLCTSIIGLLTSVLPSSVKVAKYITYIVCAVPAIRIFVIFLVIPLVEFVFYKICCFDNIEDGGHIGGDGDGVGGGEDDNGGVAGDGNNGESGVGDGGVGRDIGGDGDGVGGGEDGDVVGVGEDSEDVGVGDYNNSGAIQMSSLDSASSIV